MKFLFTLLCSMMSVFGCNAQGRTAISRPCAGSTFKASASIGPDGNITQAPCPSKRIIFPSGNIDLSGVSKIQLVDANYTNFQSIPFKIGFGSPAPIPAPASFTVAEIRPLFEGDGTFTGISSVINGKRTNPGSTFGIYAAAINLGDLSGASYLVGVAGDAYLRSPGATKAIGGRFSAFTGGNSGLVNSTPLYGITAEVDGGHNGTTPLQVAGLFTSSNLGGGGAGNITEGVGVRIVIDGSPGTTNYTSSKGISLEGWTAASGGTYTNSYGLYADNSIDRGTVKRYFIYSESTSPSSYAGDIYISDNTKGIILQSPDGTCYRYKAGNGGVLSGGVSVTCP